MPMTWSREAVLPRLRDEAVAFIEQSAEKPEPFLLYVPLTSPHTPLAVNEPGQGKSGLENACADLIMETDAAELQLYDLATDLGETTNLAATQPELLQAMLTAYQKIVAAGRSTPGPQQQNDVPVRPYPKP